MVSSTALRKRRRQRDVVLCQSVSPFLSSGMGGMQPRPSCVPNPCYPGVRCRESVNGVACGPCPDGMEGNGTHCTDVDEVDDGVLLKKIHFTVCTAHTDVCDRLCVR